MRKPEQHEQNKAKINDLTHHKANMKKIADKCSKLPKGQFKKLVDDEFIEILAEYGVTI